MKILKKILAITLSFILGFIIGFTICNPLNITEDVIPHAITVQASASEVDTTSMNDVVYLTATVIPEAAKDKSVNWSVSWKNATSTWANGKTVTDYVTITPTADGALTAEVECLQAFQEQVIVKVALKSNPNIYDTCTVDYAKRIQSVSTVLYNTSYAVKNESIQFVGIPDNSSMTDSVWQAKSFNFLAGVNFADVGTKENTFYGGSWTVEYTEGFKQALEVVLPGNGWTFGTLSYGGSLTKTYSPFEIIMALGDNGTAIVNYFDMLTNLFLSELEIQVTLNLTTQYGGNISYVYYIDLGGA